MALLGGCAPDDPGQAGDDGDSVDISDTISASGYDSGDTGGGDSVTGGSGTGVETGDGTVGSSGEDDGLSGSTDDGTDEGAEESGTEPGCPGDLDCDGLDDEDDPLPEDPYPPFIVNGTETGVIHVRLSNGDGTFGAPVDVGIPYGGFVPDPGDYPYYYSSLSVSDFDSDGRLDILVAGWRGPGKPKEIWWFERTGGPTTFSQRLIDNDAPPELWLSAADLDGDLETDIYTMSRVSDPYIVDAQVYGFVQRGDVRTTNCAVSDNPLNPSGCLFIRTPQTDLTPWFLGEWGLGRAFYGRDLDQDGLGDLIVTKYATGGASPSPLGLVTGNGDGTFTNNPDLLHTHALPVNTMVLEDFDNDGVVDLVAGCDDDGDPGSLWFYPGQLVGGVYSLDGAGGAEVVDFGDSGHGCGAAPFDYDGDGFIDLVIGHNTGGVFDPPSELTFVRGLGNGSFDLPLLIDGYLGHDARRATGPVLFH